VIEQGLFPLPAHFSDVSVSPNVHFAPTPSREPDINPNPQKGGYPAPDRVTFLNGPIVTSLNGGDSLSPPFVILMKRQLLPRQIPFGSDLRVQNAD
jgi:hypothetical protein